MPAVRLTPVLLLISQSPRSKTIELNNRAECIVRGQKSKVVLDVLDMLESLIVEEVILLASLKQE